MPGRLVAAIIALVAIAGACRDAPPASPFRDTGVVSQSFQAPVGHVFVEDLVALEVVDDRPVTLASVSLPDSSGFEMLDVRQCTPAAVCSQSTTAASLSSLPLIGAAPLEPGTSTQLLLALKVLDAPSTASSFDHIEVELNDGRTVSYRVVVTVCHGPLGGATCEPMT